jgi:hypothetical protein
MSTVQCATVPLKVDLTTGALYVVAVGGGGGGTSDPDGSAYVPGVTPGTPMLAANLIGGKLYIPAIDPVTKALLVEGSFTSTQPVSNTSSSPSQKTVGNSSSQILAANGSRKGCHVKNTGTTTLYLGLGQTPTNTAYHIALPTSGNNNDGFGGDWDGTISGVLWTGTVNAIGSGVGGTCVVTELT